jgi:hypothetical protein
MSKLALEETNNLPIEINGYAIVSDDDMIAGPVSTNFIGRARMA